VIKVELFHDAYEKMNRDKTLEHFFPANSAVLQCEMSNEDFDSFLKQNNLITYRSTIKRYQDGMICGRFDQDQEQVH